MFHVGETFALYALMSRDNINISNGEISRYLIRRTERRDKLIALRCSARGKKYLADIDSSAFTLAREKQHGACCLVKSTKIERSFLWPARKSAVPFQ